MSATVKAVVHLGEEYQENLRTIKNTDFEKDQQLFDISQKLILNQSEETVGITTIDWNTIPWVRTTLLHDRAVKLSKAKVHVFFDSVLCLGIIQEYPRSTEASSKKLKWFTKSHKFRRLDCIDVEAVRSSGNFPWTPHCSYVGNPNDDGGEQNSA